MVPEVPGLPGGWPAFRPRTYGRCSLAQPRSDGSQQTLKMASPPHSPALRCARSWTQGELEISGRQIGWPAFPPLENF